MFLKTFNDHQCLKYGRDVNVNELEYDKSDFPICVHYFKPYVYFVSGKVLVTTGYWKWNSDTLGKSEVIDLEDSGNICQVLEDYPIPVYGAVGGLLNQVDPLVCGGDRGRGKDPFTKICYIVNQPGQSSEML
jgi:hypothetical protein